MEKLKLGFNINPRWIVIFGLIVNWPGNSVRAYTLNQQERLLSEMISDLRDAYDAQLSTFNKRIAELENTIGFLLGGKLNRKPLKLIYCNKLFHAFTYSTECPAGTVNVFDHHSGVTAGHNIVTEGCNITLPGHFII